MPLMIRTGNVAFYAAGVKEYDPEDKDSNSSRTLLMAPAVLYGQYVPNVTEDDIERIVRREYPPEIQVTIRDLIRDVEVWKTRVILACLKNAKGDFRKLKGELAQASGYYREIIGDAEYPNHMKKLFRMDKLSAANRSASLRKTRSSIYSGFMGTVPATTVVRHENSEHTGCGHDLEFGRAKGIVLHRDRGSMRRGLRSRPRLRTQTRLGFDAESGPPA